MRPSRSSQTLINDQNNTLPFDHAAALVSHEQAAHLLIYDHHRVRIGGKFGVLLTHHRLLGEDAREPLVLTVVFPPVRIALAHPQAPDQIQALIDRLVFT